MPKGVYIRTKPNWNKGLKGYNLGHSFYGLKKFPSNIKREISKALKGNKNRLGIKCSEDTKRKMSEKRKLYLSKNPIPRKEKHWNWKGGQKSYKHQTSNKEYIKWRIIIFERDNWICQTCGKRSQSGEPVYLEAHHIKGWSKYPELRYEAKNGITLCRDCHHLIHKNKCKNINY